jgi:DNA-binding CsgD family transcriptional regulator
VERMLEPFGLGAEEEELYLWLLEHPRQDPCATAEPVLDELKCRGLVIREPDGSWSAMPPDIAVEMLSRAREFELHRARRVAGPLMDMYRVWPAPQDDRLEMVVGAEAIQARGERIVASARWELCGFDKPPYVAKDLNRELAALRRGVAVRAVYEREALTGRLADIDRLVAAGEQARVLPSVPFKLLVADQRWGLVPVHRGDETGRAVLVRSSPLLDALQAMFDVYWLRALALRCAEDDAEPEPTVEPVDRALLTLLAAGITDQAIARHLGLGLRTVQRRISALMRQLGAETRFQAGLQAARRGLL